MILDKDTSMTRLKQFFSDTLPNNTLDIPDLIRADTETPYSFWSPLVINGSNLEVINLPNNVQSPYIIKGKNLREVNLSSLAQIEFGSQILDNRDNLFLPLSIIQDTKIEKLELPNFVGTLGEVPTSGTLISDTGAERASFRNNFWLKTVSLGNNLMREEDNTSFKFNGFWFRNNYSLVALKLNYPYVIPIDRYEGFNTTPIMEGQGYIYVPTQDLIEAYTNNTIWGRFASKFRLLDNYATDMLKYEDTITDSWEQIINNCNSPTGYTKYNIGDTKTLYVNGAPAQMVIGAKDFDILENGNRAPLTWLSKTISIFTRYNLGTVFGNGGANFHEANGTTENPGYRALFTNTIFNAISSNKNTNDSIIKNGIKPVIKYSTGNIGAVNEWSNSIQSIETIWPPSTSELGIRNYTSPYPYFNDSRFFDGPYYYLGLTNLITDESGTVITIGTRDYSQSAYYPDILRATGKNSKMEAVAADSTNSYLIFGFCT